MINSWLLCLRWMTMTHPHRFIVAIFNVPISPQILDANANPNSLPVAWPACRGKNCSHTDCCVLIVFKVKWSTVLKERKKTKNKHSLFTRFSTDEAHRQRGDGVTNLFQTAVTQTKNLRSAEMSHLQPLRRHCRRYTGLLVTKEVNRHCLKNLNILNA